MTPTAIDIINTGAAIEARSRPSYDTAARTIRSAPAWLRYWSPCTEHAHPTTAADGRLVDMAIAGWRWDQSHNGGPRRNTPAVADWNALQTMRGLIRECAECRCATASAAAQAALDLASDVPNPCTPSGLAARFRNTSGPLFTGPGMVAWSKHIDERNAAARAEGYRSIWEAGAADAIDARANGWIDAHPEIAATNAAARADARPFPNGCERCGRALPMPPETQFAGHDCDSQRHPGIWEPRPAAAARPSYTFHADPGHAWLAVPTAAARAAGIIDRISAYSYVSADGATLYLEEDCDAPLFIDAAGIDAADIRETHSDRDSFVRRLAHFAPAIVAA